MTNVSEATNVLFICPGFFGYAQAIREALEHRGHHVAWFEDSPAADSWAKAQVRIAPWLMRARADAYFDSIVARMKSHPIRHVLVIKGEALSPGAVRRMRAAFPDARFTLYFWDSFRNMPGDSREKATLFDRVLTFDPRDAAADSSLIYRPLFYLEEFIQLRDAPQDIDVLFFGTVHGDRYRVLQRISRALPADWRFEQVLYMPARWVYWARCLQDPILLRAPWRALIFTPKSRGEIIDLIARSRIVVDIERPIQSGYTIRTVEALGAGRKLITTNPEMANADFFDPGNIAVIDRKNPKIPDLFLRSPYRSAPKSILQRYSLEGWLDDVLDTEERAI